jgi:hypothetical protein
LIYDGAGSGYFAAWFIRRLVERYGPKLLWQVWSRAGDPELAPIPALDQVLKEHHGSSFEAAFTDYCVASANTWEFDFEIFTRHGNRLVTEAFHIDRPGVSTRTSEVDWLGPLACRYYRIDWEANAITALEVAVLPEPITATDTALRALLLVIGSNGIAAAKYELAPAPGGTSAALGFKADLAGGATSAILVVLRGVAPEDSCGRYWVEIKGDG